MPIPINPAVLGVFGRLIFRHVELMWKKLAQYAGPLFAQVMVWAGLSYVTYSYGVDPIRNIIQTKMASVPPMAWAVIGITQADKAMTVILSALAIRAARRLTLSKRTSGGTTT